MENVHWDFLKKSFHYPFLGEGGGGGEERGALRFVRRQKAFHKLENKSEVMMKGQNQYLAHLRIQVINLLLKTCM